MDPATLALTAYTLAKPFLDKTQEGIARKIGEDIWTAIKKPFAKKEQNQIKDLAMNDEVQFRAELEKKLKADPNFLAEVTEAVNKANINMQQNINSYGEVGKQINIQKNNGNIQM